MASQGLSGRNEIRLTRRDAGWAEHRRAQAKAPRASYPGRKPRSHSENPPGPMHGGEKKAGEKGEVIDEEAELRLIAGPMRWPVKGEAQEQHIDGCEQRRFRKIRPRQEANDEGTFEQRRNPGKQQGNGKSHGRNIACGSFHIRELEYRGHDEYAGKNKACDKDCRDSPW